MGNEKQYYSTKEVANILGVHQKTVAAWIRAGRLRAVRPGTRDYRIHKEDLQRFLEERRTNRIK